ncbi:hypothetical protein EOPP23_03350 [Endozoicomonas sp. OPT23]|uniref:hypothetical protein n=1 Tax=Endozoicomonas sp. OPT23 TaxID=2072845 RepID=UPI00129BB865|nr:hypothetical protein [Endozoicomonas sp. OPT23]MRI32035.1 hypothetical protein [Endozoicomonas sp. OPT23]
MKRIFPGVCLFLLSLSVMADYELASREQSELVKARIMDAPTNRDWAYSWMEEDLLDVDQVIVSMDGGHTSWEETVFTELVMTLSNKGWLKRLVIGMSGLGEKALIALEEANSEEHTDQKWDEIKTYFSALDYLSLDTYKILYLSGVDLVAENRKVNVKPFEEQYPDNDSREERIKELKKALTPQIFYRVFSDMSGVPSKYRNQPVPSHGNQCTDTGCPDGETMLTRMINVQFWQSESLAALASESHTLVIVPAMFYAVNDRGLPAHIRAKKTESRQKVVRIKEGEDFISNRYGLDYYIIPSEN